MNKLINVDKIKGNIPKIIFSENGNLGNISRQIFKKPKIKIKCNQVEIQWVKTNYSHNWKRIVTY